MTNYPPHERYKNMASTARRTLQKLPKEAMTTLAGGGGGRGTRAGKQRRDDSVNCKKHPKHRQGPGVCANCLSERLAQLAAKKDRKGFRAVFLMVRIKGSQGYEDEGGDSLSSSPSSVSSYYSSSLGSSCSSPMHEKHVISREAKGSSSAASWSSNLFMNGKSVLLTKSRSLAFFPRDINSDGDHGKRSTGFWSKLTLRNSSRRSKRVQGQANLVHSKTMTEIAF